MALPLKVIAGPRALDQIKREGLTPNMVGSIFGASGSAKWLAIAGLDVAIFEDWLPKRETNVPIGLFGTSIGAFKLAAAARREPGKSLRRLAQDYVRQEFDASATPQVIQLNARKTITSMLGPSPELAIKEILSNPNFLLSFGAVRCHGPMNSKRANVQKWAMTKGFLGSLISSRGLVNMCERTIFTSPNLPTSLKANDGFAVRSVALNEDNFIDALIASGSIPVYMPGIVLPTDPDHLYHDGGLLDYHPVPSAFWPNSEKLTLYPHFYPHIIRRWFDKFIPWRRVNAQALDNVVLICPSPDFVRSLPQGRIPDRRDFMTYLHQAEVRHAQWYEAIERSYELGETFLGLCQSGDIARIAEPFSRQ